MRFTSTPIPGSGRGKGLSVPTINLDLHHIPIELEEGIYVCTVRLHEEQDQMGATMHYGPRPVFKDSRSCEIHLLDMTIGTPPETVEVTVIKRLRSVENFPSPEKLVEQIQKDNDQARAILQNA